MGKPGTLLNSFTIEGNNLSNDQTLLLSVAEANIKRVLSNPEYTVFQRFNATAAQQIDWQGTAVVIYRIAKRAVMGIDFNERTGTKKQIGGAYTTDVKLNQFLSTDFMFPRNDLERLKKNPDLAGQIIAEWQSTLITSKMMDLELIFLDGFYQHALWRYGQGDKSAILVLDFDSIKSQDSAIEVFYTLAERMLEKTNTITETEIGTAMTDWRVLLAPKPWLKITRAYTQVPMTTEISAHTLATGQLYANQILGTSIGKHNWLDQRVNAGTETAMNLDKSWNLKGFLGMAIHPEAMAMPMGFEFTTMALDNDTFNLRYHDRVWFGLPSAIRPNLKFAIMDHEPTQAEIDHANSVVAPNWAVKQPADEYGENLVYAFQLSVFDEKLAQSINEDGSKILPLNIMRGKKGIRGENYIINQAIGKLDLNNGEWIIIANNEPSQTIGDELTEDEIGTIASTSWNALIDGNKYYFMVLGPLVDGKRRYNRVEFVQVVQDKSNLLEDIAPKDEN